MPSGAKALDILPFGYGLKPVPFTPFHNNWFFRSLFCP